MRFISLAAACAATFLPAIAYAQQGSDKNDTAFGLGQIVVRADAQADDNAIGSETVGHEAIEAFNRNTLDDAASLIPGVTAGNSGGSRSERLLFVRGFDRFQVPLSIDGIRIYLPADNRLDFGRFLTPDIAEIQVAKGYASVLDGPGGMGGAVNLVTRKPTKALEVEARGELNLGRDLDYDGYTAFGLIGTRQDKWYAQASFARNFSDHWDLSGDFVPSVIANENGGKRDFSRTEDWRVNLKAGFTPNATDEYSISYTRQEGAKNAPLHVSDTSSASLRNWSWPYWNIESVYFLSTSALTDYATLKTRAYYSDYDNLLRSWDNRNQNSQALPRAFDSPYADNALGGSLELGMNLSPVDRLTFAFHYRRDEHTETQTSRPGVSTSVPEPLQTNLEKTYSLAGENVLGLTPTLLLTLGTSYDKRETSRAQEYGVPPGGSGANRLFEYRHQDAEAFNGQGRLDWKPAAETETHLSLSSRARFPTIFERFSSQFGTAEPNPDLKPERATNLELGGSRRFGGVRATAAVYYSWLTDALVSVRSASNLNRRVNIGSADYYGTELSLDADISRSLQAGANYSYIHRGFDVGTPPTGGLIRPFQLTDVPEHKGFVWLSWKPLDGIEVLPSVDFASDRTTVTPASANGLAPVYYDTGSYVLANLRVNYAITDRVEIGAGVKNALDSNYVLTDGFPEPGRQFFLTARFRN